VNQPIKISKEKAKSFFNKMKKTKTKTKTKLIAPSNQRKTKENK
jgi:hypothetical protein